MFPSFSFVLSLLDMWFVFLLLIIQSQMIWVEVWKGAPSTRSIITQLWMPVRLLPHFNRKVRKLLTALWKVVILEVNLIVIVQQRWMILLMKVWNHLYLYICEVRRQGYLFLCQSYLFFVWVVTIIDADCVYFLQ